MSLYRVSRTAQRTLTRKVYMFDTDETLADYAAVPTVEVRRLDGTLLASGTATDAPGIGVYTFVLPGGPTAPASATWQLDHLDVTWVGTLSGVVFTAAADRVEVVGDHLFGLSEARATHPSLQSDTTYPSELLAAVRAEVEMEFEDICRQAFVPRFERELLDGTDTDELCTRWLMLRKVRAVSINSVAMDAPTLATVRISAAGILTRADGQVWPAGVGNIVVEYEHGHDHPPRRVRSAGILRLRSLIAQANSGIPDRASSFTTQDGGIYRLSLPDRKRIGIPDIDAVLERYSEDLVWIA